MTGARGQLRTRGRQAPWCSLKSRRICCVIIRQKGSARGWKLFEEEGAEQGQVRRGRAADARPNGENGDDNLAGAVDDGAFAVLQRNRGVRRARVRVLGRASC